MAKLSARGRKEVFRVVRERERTDSDLINWERMTYALMSDNSILEKRDVRFSSDNRKHSYGWKKAGKLREGSTPEKLLASLQAKGYTKE